MSSRGEQATAEIAQDADGSVWTAGVGNGVRPREKGRSS
jgi:hypothetical protein